MTTPFDAEMAAVARDLIKEFGTLADFVFDNKSFDPATRGVTGTAETHTNVKVSPPFPYDTTKIDGVNFLEKDCYAIVDKASISFVPAAKGWSLRFQNGAGTWAIVGVAPYYSGDDVAAYELHLRAG